MEIRIGLRIALRDGVELAACLWLPENCPGPLPTCLMVTCYTATRPHLRAREFTDAGWAFLAVDCRGRGNSGGEFTPWYPVGCDDALDIFAWIRSQDWSNGEVATRGGSALGGIQWQLLAAQPEGYIAATLNSAAKAGYDGERLNNIVSHYNLQWRVLVHGRYENHAIYDDEAGFWTEFLRKAYREHWTLQQMAAAFGPDTGFVEEVEAHLAHPGMDEYWEACDVRPEQYAAIAQPILSVAGYWDGNQFGTLERYRRHMQYGSAAATARHYLVLGPWDHAGSGVEKREAYGVEFPANAYVPRFPLQLAFFDWARGTGPLPTFLEDRIGWYVTGLDEWRWAARYEDISTWMHSLALTSSGDTASAFDRSGQLAAAPGPDARDCFECDPFDLRHGTTETSDYPCQLTDPAYTRLLGNDGVVYTSEPLAGAIEIAGIPRLTLWLVSDASDFDLAVHIHEVLADGSLFHLTESLWRARWRRSLVREELMPIGEPTECIIDRFYFFARSIAAGSRIRLVVRSLSSIGWQRNYNTADPVALQRCDDGRVARVEVHHGPGFPSRIELPVSSPRPVC